MCSILGLRDEVAEYLRNIDPEFRYHQTNQEWIKDYFGARNKELSEEQTQEEKLVQLGFTPIKARDLSSHLDQNEYSNHKTTLQWAQDNVESQFKYNILLAAKPKYGITKPYNTTGNLEIEFEIPTDEEEGAVLVKALDTFALPVEELEPGIPWLHDYWAQEGKSLDSTKYWFHGTDHDSAINIIRNGIRFTKARRADFSDQGGFYLSSSYEMAHKWPKASKREPSAVIVFKAPNDGMFAPGEGEEFLEANEKWKKLVTYFRKGSAGFSKKERTAYDDLKYVFGPMSIRPYPQNMTPQEFQLCIKDKSLAKQFFNEGRTIAKVIFFHDD